MSPPDRAVLPRDFRFCWASLPWWITFVLAWMVVWASPALAVEVEVLERSFWLHASLGLLTQRNYFGADFPATPMPTQEQVQKAAGLLTGSYAANRLYLIYHRELPIDEARELFLWWRKACPAGVEIVPALVTRMYDRPQTPIFASNDLAALADFFHDQIHCRHVAIYDIAPRRDLRDAAAVIASKFSNGLIRLGLQPGEALQPPFVGAAEDTWSAFCHGKDNEQDWQQPGFGAATLRQWVLARNDGTFPIAWDLIAVAWDYSATVRGAYPGYDDAAKNMPLPVGRNRAAWRLIREVAQPTRLSGFSSDLYILHENSQSAAHDGRTNSFYECLKRGEEYHGYYRVPFEEITGIYRELRDRRE